MIRGVRPGRPRVDPPSAQEVRCRPCPCSSATNTSSRRISFTASATASWTGCQARNPGPDQRGAALDHQASPGHLVPVCRDQGIWPDGAGDARIGHYFSAFQTHVISQAEIAMSRFSMEQALLILEREAKYKCENPSLAGLFIFQFESLSRNRLGYIRDWPPCPRTRSIPKTGTITSSCFRPGWATLISPT